VAEFMKIIAASKRYSIGANTIRKAVRSGELKSYKPNCRDYLLKSTDIEAWIESKIV
jgi:excisionase family DNA binding protein